MSDVFWDQIRLALESAAAILIGLLLKWLRDAVLVRDAVVEGHELVERAREQDPEHPTSKVVADARERHQAVVASAAKRRVGEAYRRVKERVVKRLS